MQLAGVALTGRDRRCKRLRATQPSGLLLLSEGTDPPQALAISGYWLF
jgi:hypothetical protein